jgi:hypothetical protein
MSKPCDQEICECPENGDDVTVDTLSTCDRPSVQHLRWEDSGVVQHFCRKHKREPQKEWHILTKQECLVLEVMDA